jgi:chemotaxis protein MotA
MVSLESEAAGITDPFLRKALSLAVDGTELQELRKMMEIDIALSEQNAEAEAKVWESAGGYAPTIGIIGAVMGLIQVMKHLEDIKEVGHGIAVAFVATVYGVGAANLFFLPAASKLRARAREALVLKDMILEGVAGIVEGLNPTLIRMKLKAYQIESGKSAAREKGKSAATRPQTAAADAR